MRIHNCPKCELRFADHNEVREHLIDDHGVPPDLLDEPFHAPHDGGRRPPDPSRERRATEP
jgi:hypothetical protein